MKEQNIEQLFKDTFSNFEADVNPNTWANISQGLQAPVPTAAPTNPGWFGNMGWSKASLVIAGIVVVIGALIYFNTEKSDSELAAVKEIPQTLEDNTVAVIPSIEQVVPDQTNPEVIKYTNAQKPGDNGNKISEPNSTEQSTAVAIFDSPKGKENAVDNSLTPVSIIQQPTKSQVQKTMVQDESSSVENTALINVQPDVNTTTNFPEDIS